MRTNNLKPAIVAIAVTAVVSVCGALATSVALARPGAVSSLTAAAETRTVLAQSANDPWD